MKNLIFLLAFIPALLSGQTFVVGGSGGGGTGTLSQIDSTVDVVNLTLDTSPDSIVSLSNGGFKYAETTNINFGYYQAAYASGTTYNLTNTSALVNFGTTDPDIVIGEAGTYMLIFTANIKYAAATYAANQTATLKLRRLNNTAADITYATSTCTMEIVTTYTGNVAFISSPPVIYTTTNTDDNIQLWGAVSSAPSAGNIEVTSCSVIAIKIK